MMHDDPRHGTYAGYQQHIKADEPACGPCREANRDYTRQLRLNPVHRRRSRETSKAHHRAAWRLIDEHRAEYERLYAEELAALRVKS